MKLALVSQSNGCFGGASYFAENLGRWLSESDHEVVQFCVTPRSELREGQRALGCTSLLGRAVRHVNWRVRRLGLLEPFPWEYWFGLKQVTKAFDVFHFHDLYKVISPRTLWAVSRHRPVVFTAHDCSPFTGGCLYPRRCERFRANCGRCPKRKEIGWFDFTSWNLKKVRGLARNNSLHYVFPSRWIYEEASRSLRFGGMALHIRNGFDVRPYEYRQRCEARKVLGLDPKRKIVAVSSATLSDERKGLSFALRAVEANREQNPFLVLIGSMPTGAERALRGLDTLGSGFVESRSRLGLFYAAADVLLFPSLADNLPITIQEAMGAGTPVLAFDVGGIPELVKHGETGWLVPLGDQEALNRALRVALESSETEALGERARKFVVHEYDVQRCVERHLQVYRQVMELKKTTRI
jgi:glycosyltransferase involved in cell wall biosynthesis